MSASLCWAVSDDLPKLFLALDCMDYAGFVFDINSSLHCQFHLRRVTVRFIKLSSDLVLELMKG